MIDTRIWICPKMCGCELKIKADWTKDAEVAEDRRISYQHPKPFTITVIEAENTCPDHENLKTAPVSGDPYNGSPGYICLGESCTHLDSLQRPKHQNPKPLSSLSEAEKLYVGLYRYNGLRWQPDTCDCSIYQCYDKSTETTEIVAHERHSHKCVAHLYDDDRHTFALADNRLKNTVEKMLLDDADLADAIVDGAGNVVKSFKKNIKFGWTFDENRNIQIALTGVTAEKQNSVTLALRETMGNDRIKNLA